MNGGGFGDSGNFGFNRGKRAAAGELSGSVFMKSYFSGMNMNAGRMGANANMRGKRASAGKIVFLVM